MKLSDIEKLKLKDLELRLRRQIAFSDKKDIKDVTIDEVVLAFEAYKTQLRNAENIRIAEVERLRTLQIRIDELGKDHGLLVSYYLKNKSHNSGGYNSAAFDKHHVDKSDCKFWRYNIPKPTLEELESIRISIKNTQVEKDSQRKWKEVRQERDSILQATDYTQIADCPITSAEKAEYRGYRSYLRSIPEQYSQATIDTAIVMSFSEYKASK